VTVITVRSKDSALTRSDDIISRSSPAGRGANTAKDGYIQESSSECSNNYGQRQRRHPRTPPAYNFRDRQLMFHKMYQGRQPLIFVDTGLYQGGRHDWNGVHNKRDLVWAHRLDRVLKYNNVPVPRSTLTAPKQDAGSSLISRHPCDAAARYYSTQALGMMLGAEC
jgi:hypothetical protein